MLIPDIRWGLGFTNGQSWVVSQTVLGQIYCFVKCNLLLEDQAPWLSRNWSPTVFHQALWDCSEGKWLYYACRHWQDLGYLIIYITGRPDMQKQRVVSWLSQHNFPQGMIFFSEGLVHDPLRQKTIFLRNLVQEVSLLLLSPHFW